jgi:hypothetical protein
VGENLTPEALADELTRLNAAFGSPRDRSPDMMRVLANEWFKALGGFGRKTVNFAINRIIATNRFWPAIAEVRDICVKEDRDWQDVYGLISHANHLTDYTGTGRLGLPVPVKLTEAEEIAARVASTKRMKDEYKSLFEQAPRWTDRLDEWAPSSKVMEASSALRNSCAAKRARGEQTCEPSCQRQSEGCKHTQSQSEAA